MRAASGLHLPGRAVPKWHCCANRGAQSCKLYPVSRLCSCASAHAHLCQFWAHFFEAVALRAIERAFPHWTRKKFLHSSVCACARLSCLFFRGAKTKLAPANRRPRPGAAQPGCWGAGRAQGKPAPRIVEGVPGGSVWRLRRRNCRGKGAANCARPACKRGGEETARIQLARCGPNFGASRMKESTT